MNATGFFHIFVTRDGLDWNWIGNPNQSTSLLVSGNRETGREACVITFGDARRIPRYLKASFLPQIYPSGCEWPQANIWAQAGWWLDGLSGGSRAASRRGGPWLRMLHYCCKSQWGTVRGSCIGWSSTKEWKDDLT